MATQYEIRVRDANGAMVGRLGLGLVNPNGDLIRPFHYVKDLQTAGMLRFRLNGSHPIIDEFEKNGQVEVWRNVDGAGWYRDFIGLLLDDYTYLQDDELKYDAYLPGHKIILSWAINAWSASTANKTVFSAVKAETIMKALVTHNLTSSATTGNGRKVTFQCPYTIQVEADGSGGNTLNWSCAWKNVLTELTALTQVGGGDYDLIRDPDSDGSYTKFEFRFYSGQRGSDLTDEVILAVSRGNLTDANYAHRGSQAKTCVIVGGQGEKDNRDIEVRTSAEDGASMHREAFHNATNYEKGDTAGLQDRGDQFLEDNSDAEEFSFKVLDVANGRYGIDYCYDSGRNEGILGDLITVIRPHDQVSETHKVEGVTVSVNNMAEENIILSTVRQ